MKSRTTDGITDPVYRPVDGGVVEITMTRKNRGGVRRPGGPQEWDM